MIPDSPLGSPACLLASGAAAMDSLSEGSCREMELGSSSSEPLSLGKREQEAPGKQDRLDDSTSPSCLSAAMSDAEGDTQLEASDGGPALDSDSSARGRPAWGARQGQRRDPRRARWVAGERRSQPSVGCVGRRLGRFRHRVSTPARACASPLKPGPGPSYLPSGGQTDRCHMAQKLLLVLGTAGVRRNPLSLLWPLGLLRPLGLPVCSARCLSSALSKKKRS